MSFLDKEVIVNTRFGKLTVPTAEIRRIEFGLRIPEATAKLIEASIVDLGGADFKRREAAAVRLVELREMAYPALQRAARTANEEAARRAQDALKTLRDTVPAERLALKPHDTIVTTDFSIAGRIEADIFKVRTPYFGDGQVRLHELRTIRWQNGDPEGRLVVDAAKYANQQETWMDTGLVIARGTKLQLLASGTVDLWPIAPEVGRYLASPDGQQQGGQVNVALGGGVWVANNGVVQAAPAPGIVQRGAAQPTPGMLVGRIGESGAVFIVGRTFNGVATEEGKLYLRIMPSPWNNASTGNYEVRVNTEER
jgi:hypothetical protein